jgi:DnaJ-class molecular chaperone
MATVTCGTCKGDGKFRGSTCQTCQGTGEVERAGKQDRKDAGRRQPDKKKKGDRK